MLCSCMDLCWFYLFPNKLETASNIFKMGVLTCHWFRTGCLIQVWSHFHGVSSVHYITDDSSWRLVRCSDQPPCDKEQRTLRHYIWNYLENVCWQYVRQSNTSPVTVVWKLRMSCHDCWLNGNTSIQSRPISAPQVVSKFLCFFPVGRPPRNSSPHHSPGRVAFPSRKVLRSQQAEGHRKEGDGGEEKKKKKRTGKKWSES